MTDKSYLVIVLRRLLLGNNIHGATQTDIAHGEIKHGESSLLYLGILEKFAILVKIDMIAVLQHIKFQHT